MIDDDTPGADLATVHQLPVVRDARPPAETDEVYDGEIVDEGDPLYAGLDLTRQRDQAIARIRGYRHDAVRVAHAVRVVVEHQHTRRTTKALGRHLSYLLLGLRELGRKVWDARSYAFHRDMAKKAAAAGNHELALEWEGRIETAKKGRHDRSIARTTNVPRRIRGWLSVALLAVGGLLLLGAMLTWADKNHDIADVVTPLEAVASIARWIVIVLTVAWGPILLAVPWLAVAGLWYLGRRSSDKPDWLAPATAVDGGTDPRAILPTTGAILEALRHLPIPALKQAFKDGWGSPGWPTQIWADDPHRDGEGWRAQIILPQGVPVSKISNPAMKEIFAHNLVRLPVEVWPMEPKKRPGVMDLWVADQGFLTGPVPPHPLLAQLDTTQADYWKGVPVGVNIRGESVTARLFEANYAAGGVMGSGKSTNAINLVAGTILDPLTRADVIVCAENYDYEPMRPRLATLQTGIGPQTIDVAISVLTEAYLSLEHRGKALQNPLINPEGSRSLTRAMAERDSRCHPWIIVLDEIQRLLLDEKRGEEALDILIQLINAARKYSITLILMTPEPTAGSLPRKIMSVISHKLCYAIGDQTANDAVLGTGSYKAGVSAVGLEPKTDESDGDVGTAMVRGFYPKPGLLRSYYLNTEDLKRVTARALQIQAEHGRGNADGTGEVTERRDLLTDVAEVMGGAERVRSDAVRRWLIQNWPDSYDGWSPQRFAAELGAAMETGEPIHLGRVEGQAGQRFIARDEVLDVLDRRTENEAEDEEQAEEDNTEEDENG